MNKTPSCVLRLAIAVADLRYNVDGRRKIIKKHIDFNLEHANSQLDLTLYTRFRKALKGGRHESNWKTSQRL